MVGSDENSLLGLQIAVLFLCPHKAEREIEGEREKESDLVSALLERALIPS